MRGRAKRGDVKMEGQMELSEFIKDDKCETYKIKPLIYSMSLTCYKTICPYCKIDHPDSRESWMRHNEFFYRPKNHCYSCGKKFDDVNLDIRKSKDYLECERLGLNGAVYKDENGHWREWKDPYEKKGDINCYQEGRGGN